jgi:hypothetical protein
LLLTHRSNLSIQAIREFVSCQELLDVAEEIRDGSQRVPDQVSTVDEVLFSSSSASDIPRSLSPYMGVHFRHGRSIFGHFHQPEFCAIPAMEQGYQERNVITGVEFDRIWKKIDQIETDWIPNYCQHQLF